MSNSKFKFWNNISAWIVFVVALITYLLTLEPTVSFWDCGEFISSAFKLEVGHPPGAPLFMLLGRFFSMFTGDLSKVAMMINSISAIAGAFTILFLFWTITYFARKILIKNNEYTLSYSIIILASGFVGSLAYTFSDTFWFSAVEAEVYSLSSLFTAFVFWAILKWEDEADLRYSNRWIILIAYVMGLSIGVHLLNLLVIPAIVFVYYFKKYDITKKGILYTSLISIILLAFIQYGIIQGYFIVASKFELLFVNSFHFGFNSGLYFYILLTFALLAYGIYYTQKKNKQILNMLFLGITVILIGYSTYATIYIRAAANTPMNENNPENVFSLISYLNREQYGSRPLIWGQYYDAEFVKDENGDIYSENKYTYIPEGKKYTKIIRTNPEYFYESKDMTFFPRMYSRDESHINSYRVWGGTGSDGKPHFINNIIFFGKYQLGQMYLRYFMWNFAGRQNDEQGQGHFLRGNWISGIPFIDAVATGPQKNIPDSIKNNQSRNKYYLIPLILGIIGLMFSFKSDKQNASSIMLLFFFTGIAIVLYLNQTPYQPRERDYAYAGSFYAFAIWIGISIPAIFSRFKNFLPDKVSVSLAILIGITAPVIMAFQNWDDHDRSGRYTARDFAKNQLNSCEKNAILFTFGDNDTFPLWYVQEVEGFRTDVKVVNTSLLGTDWYINQMRRKSYDSPAVPFKMAPELYREGKRDAIYITNNYRVYIDEKYFADEYHFKNEFNDLKNRLFAILDNSEYPNKKMRDYNKISVLKPKLTPMKFASIVGGIYKKQFVKENNINELLLDSLAKNTETFLQKVSEGYLPLQSAMDFVAADLDNTKYNAGTDDEMNYIPSKKICLKTDKKNAVKYGKFSDKEIAKFNDYIYWKISRNYYYKNDMAVLEIIARNNWHRPIYFSSTGNSDEYAGLEEYFRLDGFAYKLVPYKNTGDELGSVNTDILFDNLMNNFSWGRMNEPDVLVDNNIRRVINILDIRGTFIRLAESLINEHKNDKAEKVLDRVTEILPDNKLPYDQTVLYIIDLYNKCGNTDKANKLAKEMLDKFTKEYQYYNSLTGNYRIYTKDDRNTAANIIKALK